MNSPRVIVALRELADALEAEETDDSTPAKGRKRPPRAPAFPAPLRAASDVAKMRARKMLRQRGVG